MKELTQQHKAAIDTILDLFNRGMIDAVDRDKRIEMITGKKKEKNNERRSKKI